MENPLGFFLRQLRLLRGLSQAQASRTAQIARVTLNRWETGIQQPRLQDLESLLMALRATLAEREKAFELIGAPKLRGQTRRCPDQISEKRELGPQPHSGDVLRALRLRKGLSQEETALRIGVTTRTLRRWEATESWPSLSSLHSLCFCLEAQTDELLALSTGRLSSLPDIETASLEELRVHGYRLYFFPYSSTGQDLKELGFLMLEIQLWPHAARSEAGRQVLSEIYSYHAQYLSSQDRFVECGNYADRALDLWPIQTMPTTKNVMAGITSARSAVYRGVKPAPQRGIEVLSLWYEAARWPEYKAWILSDMAEYLVKSGEREHAIALANQATTIAAQCDNLHELYNRELDEVRILVQAGQPRQALKLIQKNREELYLDQPVKFYLQEVLALLMLKETSKAHDLLEKSLQLIEARGLTHLNPKAQKLKLEF